MRSRFGAPFIVAALAGAALSCSSAPVDREAKAGPAASTPVMTGSPVAAAAPPSPSPMCSARALPAKKAASAPPGRTAEAASAEAARKAAVQKALGRVPQIEKSLATLRQLPFKKPVVSQYQSTQDFRAHVAREIGSAHAKTEYTNTGRALSHLGMFPGEIDLADMVESTMVSQVGAHYDPRQGKFFVVMLMGDDLMADALMAHELTHALQDQHFDLLRYLGLGKDGKPTEKLTSDQETARRFVIEGEATLLMTAYPVYKMAGQSLLDKEKEGLTRKALAELSSMDAERLRELSRSQGTAMGDVGADIQRAMEALDEIPPFILMPLIAPYLQGARPVHEVYAARGWAGVADLYAHPPESTEQLLHPVEKLVGTRDFPVTLTLSAPSAGAPSGSSSARELMMDTFGELGWRAYFETWCTNDLTAAAAGWDGDTAAVYDTGTSLLGVVATTWDSEQDATEFLNAYVASLGARFPTSKVDFDGERAKVARGNGALLVVERRELDVLVVDGAASADQIALAAPVSRGPR